MRTRTESIVRDSIAAIENGKTEVRLESGAADVMTSDEIIEVKYWRHWKSAIGQALVYSRDAKKRPRIHLFCLEHEKHKLGLMKPMIERHCNSLGIALSLSAQPVNSVPDCL
jgi:hypothetical protein